MPKSVRVSPIFRALTGPQAGAVIVLVVPKDGAGTIRGAEFPLFCATDGSAVTGPDGAVIEAPVPPIIQDSTLRDIQTGAADIQSQIDVWDAAGLLDAYY